LVIRAAEVHVRQLERQVRVQSPAAKGFPGGVVALVGVYGVHDIVRVVDIEIEASDAGTSVETGIVVHRVCARCGRKRCSRQNGGDAVLHEGSPVVMFRATVLPARELHRVREQPPVRSESTLGRCQAPRRSRPMIKATPATTRNTKNRIFAMDAAPAAMLVKPKSAAIRAM